MDETSSEEWVRVLRALAEGGCVAPDAEAEALFRAAGDGAGPIEELVARRLRGEPLAWITGSVLFCGVSMRVDPGVFVPRPHTEALARRAVTLLPAEGIAVDLCTGSGAVAAVLGSARPRATVFATDVDPAAVECARRNGVRALLGDLDEPLPPSLRGRVDVMTAVVPYVPTEELHLLPRDVLANEPRRALDGGPRGTAVLVRAAGTAARWLRPGGGLLLEIGGDQADELKRVLADAGLSEIRVHRDSDGYDRAIEARLPKQRLRGICTSACAPIRAAAASAIGVGGRRERVEVPVARGGRVVVHDAGHQGVVVHGHGRDGGRVDDPLKGRARRGTSHHRRSADASLAAHPSRIEQAPSPGVSRR